MSAISWRERAPLPLPRAGYAAGIIGGRFVVAGGSYWEGGRKRRTRAVDIYDPATDRWSSGPALPAELSDSVSVTTGAGVYVLGGLTDHGPSPDTLVLQDGRWNKVRALELPEAKIRSAGAAEGSRIYVVGGQREFGNEAASDQVWMCDSALPSQGWTALPPYPAGPHVVSAAAVCGGALYVFGGFRIVNPAAENQRGVWRFDLGRHSWRQVGELPEARRAFCAEPGDGKILLFGGYTDDFSADVLVFDPVTNAASRAGALPRAVADARFLRIGKHWHTAGGEIGIKIRGGHNWEGSDAPAG